MTLMMGVNDVARELDMSPSTVKKYYLEMEKKGYVFRKNQQGHLMFEEKEINYFRKIVFLKNQPGMSVDKAIAEVTASITDMTVYIPPEESETPSDIKVMAEQMAEMKGIMISMQKELIELRKDQAEAKLLIESKNNEEKEKQLSYGEMMDKTHQLFQEIMDEIATSKEKRTFWSKLFKKS